MAGAECGRLRLRSGEATEGERKERWAVALGVGRCKVARRRPWRACHVTSQARLLMLRVHPGMYPDTGGPAPGRLFTAVNAQTRKK